ncbi:hypothetical protein CesoFtcFv8_004374 [Champsocephalus esox]|uniref:Uncharacterized protein n=1 Tax=Champsocephalus esox TaxID=159716 RepID=A0AAN8CUE8_9TELE|nr:hypothetical protein CesoFtcFv8_004374 [Champsocephalus esox]
MSHTPSSDKDLLKHTHSSPHWTTGGMLMDCSARDAERQQVIERLLSLRESLRAGGVRLILLDCRSVEAPELNSEVPGTRPSI